jgi:hypothetical protein
MRVPVVTLNDRAKAAPIQRRLANAGIAAEINDELLEKLWFVSKEESDARIHVPMDQLERAQKLLLEWDASEGILREAIRCPECQSLQVHYPQFAHRSLIPNLMMGFLARIGLIEKESLLRELSLHVAKRRNQALHFVSGEKALSFRRRNRTNHVAAEAGAIRVHGLMVCHVIQSSDLVSPR